MDFFIDSLASSLTHINLKKLARSSKFIQRNSSSFSAEHFLLALLKAVQSGKTSFHDIASYFSKLHSHSISRQAFHKKINLQCSHFLQAVIENLIKSQNHRPLFPNSLTKFNRILLEDTTVLPVHQSNHQHFPGNGNGVYKTAGAKIHQIIDWLHGETIHSQLHHAKQPDQGLSQQITSYLKPNDLVLRDMGFYNLSQFQCISQQNAHWISRLPSTAAAVEASSEKKLNELLKNSTHHIIEGVFIIGSREKVRCKIVAIRLPKKTVEANKRKRRADAKRRGSTPKRESFLRDEWSIICANTQLDIPSEELYRIYQIRWNIEIQYRGMKQNLNLKKSTNRKTNKHHLKCLLLTVIIYQLLVTTVMKNITLHICKEDYTRFSYEKLCSLVSKEVQSLTIETNTLPLKIDKRAILQEKRRRQPSYSKSFMCLG